MSGWIDFHAHILPGVDHGCDGVETALAQLAAAERAGVGTVAATSHFYPDRRGAQTFLERRDAAAAALRAAYAGPVRVRCAAEVFLCEGLDHFPGLRLLCIEGTDILLTEMPAPPWGRRYVDALHALRERGCKPVLAHIERYPREQVEPLLRMGFAAQVNAAAFAHPLLRGRLRGYLRAGCVRALGSDLHGAPPDAYRDYVRAMRLLGADGERLQAAMASLLEPAVR